MNGPLSTSFSGRYILGNVCTSVVKPTYHWLEYQLYRNPLQKPINSNLAPFLDKVVPTNCQRVRLAIEREREREIAIYFFLLRMGSQTFDQTAIH